MPTTPPTVRDKAPIASRLRVACMRISRRVRFESESQVLPHHFSVLLRLEEGPKTPRELADIEKVSAPSMTRTVAAIVDNGWAGRAADPDDGRQVIVTLTAAGRQVLRETRRAREGWMAKRFSDLSDDEIETLARATTILERIAAS
jgi:DNA-binding MarR family transcriptional regulator